MFKYRTNEWEDKFLKRTKRIVCYFDYKLNFIIPLVCKSVGMRHKDIDIFLNLNIYQKNIK